MPNPKSQSDILRDLEGLLEASDRTPEIRALVEAELQAVNLSYSKIRTLKAEQEELAARRQEVTQQLGIALAEAKENAVVFRSVVRGKLGPRNERLVHFKIAPLRKRPRKRQAAEKPLNGEASGPLAGSGD